MWRYIILLLAIAGISTSSTANAGWHLIELEGLDLGYKKFLAPGRDPLIYPERNAEAIDINVNTRFLSYFFWQNNLEGVTTDAQFRSVAYQFRVGLRLTSMVDISYYHLSAHVLDRPHSYMDGFQVKDAVELRIYLYSEKERKGSLLW